MATPRNSDQDENEKKLAHTTFSQDNTDSLESWIDEMDSKLPPLKNFILPSGGLTASQLHVARTVCRRAERDLVPLKAQGAVDPTVYTYVNRLSDYLFMLARICAQYEGEAEVVYKKARRRSKKGSMQDFTSTDDFMAAFEAEAAIGNKFIVLFSATTDEAGKSWCGDCNVAKDLIKRIID